MFPSINPVKRLQRELADEIDTGQPEGSAPAQSPSGLTDLLKSFGPSGGDAARPAPSGSDWSALIDRIRSTAQHIRDVEDEARVRDDQMDVLVRRVEVDMAEAETRVRVAEARIALVETRAADQIRAAEDRARLAEERARVSEGWLARIEEVIQREFAGPFEAAD